MIKRFVAPTLLVALFAAILIQLPAAIAARAADYEWFDPIIIVRALVLENFVEEPTEEQMDAMQVSMINAMIDELDDPHTVYVPAQQRAEFDKSMMGEYVGIGAEINIENDYLVIVSPMEDSPALEAGVMAGDVVLEINGETTFMMPVDRCIELLTGEPDTQVTIRVMHEHGEEETIRITRRRIVTHTVKGAFRVGEDWVYEIDPENGIGYVRITQFNATTVEGMQRALEQLKRENVKGLILDVRFDPGGGLEEAVALSDMFLETGTIVSVKGRRREEVTFAAKPGGTFPDVPIVVIVNEGSASASEILAGALQENGRAKVLGERTFGKGSVQEVRPLPENMGTLKVTTAYYYLPSGRHLHRHHDSPIWGVEPDPGFHVAMSNEEYREMNLAKRNYDAIRAGGFNGDAHWADSAWIETELKDRQLARALEAMQGRLTEGAWPRVGEEGGAGPAIASEIHEMIEFRNRLSEQIVRTDERIAELSGLKPDTAAALLPEGAELGGGILTLTDESGKVIASFRIVDDHDLEMALEYARLERLN